MKRIIKTVLILLIIISDSKITNAQVSTGFNFGSLGDYVGWDGTTTIPLDIRHNNTTTPQNIDFYTDNSLRMSIVGNTGINNGFVGIGSNLGAYVSSFQLDVENQINVNFNNVTPINQLGVGYHIGGITVIQIPGVSNLYAGTNSGVNWTTGEGNT